MSLSVKVVLAPVNGGSFLHIVATTEEGQGSLDVAWGCAFGPEYTIVLEPPQGGMRMSHKEVKRRSARQERQRIEAVGGRRHSGSGSRSGYKSDGSLGYRWRMENKFTTKESYRVALSDLRKLRSECLNGQAPVFNVDFQDKHTGETKDSWVLVPSKEWERLVNATSDDS